MHPQRTPLPGCSGNAPAATSFAAYTGSSMYPTLREPEMLELVPYDNRPVRVGDVVFFQQPGEDRPIVHRVVRATPEGLSTLGDNNTREDAFLLNPESIQGRVVAAWRGRKRRRIAGGWQGRLAFRRLRWRGGLLRGAAPLLHPLYQTLCRRGWIARLLPARCRPRVVVFQARGRDQFQLLLGRRAIGRYDDTRQQWQIQRPYHLLVDGRALPTPKGRERVNRKVLTEQRHVMPRPPVQGTRHELVLADGSRWEFAGGDPEAESIVSKLAWSMRMKNAPEAPPRGPRHRLLVHVDAASSVADCYVPRASGPDGTVTCILSPCEDWGGPYVNLVRLSLIVARQSQGRGGMLLHGALAERDGLAVLMVAPGGTGKTTASSRLPVPWRSLCDDTTLVVRDTQGRYRAHPWPTWSRFLYGGQGDTWDVQQAVPLKGIFFLVQAAEDRAEPVGPGHAVSMLVEGLRQANQFMPLGLMQEEVRALHLEGFNNLCALAKAVPAHLLHISLNGSFWREIERTLEGVEP